MNIGGGFLGRQRGRQGGAQKAAPVRKQGLYRTAHWYGF